MEPWAYLKDVLTRMPTQPDSRIAELLPQVRSRYWSLKWWKVPLKG